MEVLRGEDKKQEAERLLQNRRVLVLFFMDGCGHCEANKPAWDKLTKSLKGMKIIEIEASATPTSSGVSSFPTMKYISDKGETTVEGQRHSAKEIATELGLKLRPRGRSTRRRTFHRRNRKLRHRTLRNYKPLV